MGTFFHFTFSDLLVWVVTLGSFILRVFSLTHFSQVLFHIKTSHLFCSAKQMTGFYMKHNTGLKWVKNSWTLSMNSKLFRGNNFFVSLKLSLLILTCFISYILLPYFMPIMYKARCQAILPNKMLRFSVLTH